MLTLDTARSGGRQLASCALLLTCALGLASADCSSPPERAPVAAATGSCAASGTESEHIPFALVNLGPAVHEGLGYVRGHRARALVRNQREWAQLWKVIGDTIPLPKVEFGDSVLIVVASEDFGSGPARVEIEDVRTCRRGGQVVAFLRVHSQQQVNDYGDRSIRATLVGRSHIGDRPVEFVDLPPEIRH